MPLLTRKKLVDLMRGSRIINQDAYPTATTNATLTAAQMLGGVLRATPSSGTATYTTLTGTQLAAAMRQPVQVGDCFDLYIINISTSGNDNIVLAMGVGITLVGNNDIEEEDAVANSSSALFRFRNTAVNTFDCLRLA